ncbi:beta-lactamase family protein [Peteryoungia desertarenae]|uniref:Beta-lactamase family protein n=1 Tax=Peteryoungia desertarenae TaxID=1813451 RepID=A0ABX6QM34_9HYPH|nr:serine hydrolase domain-containing protein [Peteryoungia desertarenae]QLF69668.1 beta-lactamase family protein [Peteryoungia desertarenae]
MALLLPGLAHAGDIATIQYREANGAASVMVEGGATVETPFAIASVGKTMTSVAVLRLVEDGMLKLDETVGGYLPDAILSGLPQSSRVTLRQLLTMTSGLPDYLDDSYLTDALDDPDTVQEPHTALTYAFDQAPLFEPGTDFNYSNTNYVLLGLIIEAVTGETYAAAMERLVLRPAGMTGAFVFGSVPLPESFPTGHEDGQQYRDYYAHEGFGDGGVIASAADVAKFYHALFTKQSLLSPAMMRELLNDPLGVGYGMGIELEGPIVGHSGGDLGFSSDVRLDRDSGKLAIMLSASANSDSLWTYEALEP